MTRKRMSFDTRERLHRDLRPVAAQINELADKYNVSPTTVSRHALLLPVPIPALPEWNERIAAR